jgi:hypothetical protein
MKPCRTCIHHSRGDCLRGALPGPYPWESPEYWWPPTWWERSPLALLWAGCGPTARHHKERIG